MQSNHLILHHPLLLLSSIFHNIRVFSKESFLPIRWPKCWNFSFSISSSNEYSGLISFRMDWSPYCPRRLSRVFSNTTVQKHQFFGNQLFLQSNSHIHTWLLEKPYPWLAGPFWQSILTLVFNTLSRLVIAFLPRSKCLLNSWLQSPSAVILEPPK